MKTPKTKHSIYLRTFAWLLSIWLILMLAFSAYLMQESRQNSEDIFAKDIATINTFVDDSVTELGLWHHNFFTDNFDYAVYSKEYDLIYDTCDTWICHYDSNHTSESRYVYDEYGYFYLSKWFTAEEMELYKHYLTYQSDSTTYGDFFNYQLSLYGWIDGDEIIPEKITVTNKYVQTVDENGNVSGAYLDYKYNEHDFEIEDEITEGLDYCGHVYIQDQVYLDKKPSLYSNENETHLAVTDVARVENAAANFWTYVEEDSLIKSEPIGLFAERYFMVYPLQLDSSEEPYVIALSGEANYLTPILSSLLTVWLVCLGVFAGTAWVLSSQTWKIYQKKEELEKQRRDTTNAIAHDLKTPLAAISGYSENLINNIHTEKREHYAMRIQDNVHRIDNIVQEMLSISHLESGLQEISSEELSLQKITKAVVDTYEYAISEKEISLSIDGDAKIIADKNLIYRAIDNFISNAAAHTNQYGQIEIEIIPHHWSISNTGNKVPEEQLKSIWQAYYKTDNARSNPRSSGLGLSIVKSIMELHGFDCGAENTANGIKFWFSY